VIKRIGIFLLAMSLCASSWGQITNIMVSPKLSKFLSDYPQAQRILTNAFSNAFSNKSFALFYFYSNVESHPRAFHYYPDTAGWPRVVLCIRENQSPVDEFITLLFETLNSKGESVFTNLEQKAYLGTISKEQFAKEILKCEFDVTKSTRHTLLGLKLKNREKNGSYYYHRFVECPTNFDDFLSYSKKVSPDRDAMKEYELKYDWLRKMYLDSNSSSNSVSPQN
jgi:hypothetical protein